MRKTIIFAGIISIIAGPAIADSVRFKIKSDHPYRVQIKFYSQTRNHIWPSATRAYTLYDSTTHEYRLNCSRGEKICYGAWVVGDNKEYWGVGQRDKHSCRGCCLTCNEGVTVSKRLTSSTNQVARPASRPGGQVIDHGPELIAVDE